MDPCSTETLLAQVDVSEVWGVGRQNCKKLNAMGIQSVLDLINANPKEIKKQFSIVMEKTVLELQGLSCIDLSDDTVAKSKSSAAVHMATQCMKWMTLKLRFGFMWPEP